MKEIVVATKNKGKIAEIEAALAGMNVKVLALSDFGDIPEAVEDGQTFLENAILKAKHYMKYTSKACVADDSGLEVDVLTGAPGIYSARYAGECATDKENNIKLLHEMSKIKGERSARFRCVLAFIDINDTLLNTDGTCEGVILEAPQGEAGFGYDPLFYIPNLQKTMAEMTVVEKNKISHRGEAIRSMAAKLKEYL